VKPAREHLRDRRRSAPARLELATSWFVGRRKETTWGSGTPLPRCFRAFSVARGNPRTLRAATDCQSFVSQWVATPTRSRSPRPPDVCRRSRISNQKSTSGQQTAVLKPREWHRESPASGRAYASPVVSTRHHVAVVFGGLAGTVICVLAWKGASCSNSPRFANHSAPVQC
jgi:hypothetical protein